MNDATLLQIAEQTKPVIIIDPLRFFHDAKENDSTEMTAVMQALKGLASYGCAVIALHHPAKTEGSTGRGSSAIRGHSDLALLQSLDRNSSLITLTIDKNRNGGSNRKMTVRADFESGSFELTSSPSLIADREKLDLIEGIIRSNPGVSQTTICKSVGGKKAKCLVLLNKDVGSRWHIREAKGPHNAMLYFIGKRPSVVPGTAGNNGNGSVEGGVAVPTVPCSYKGTGEQHTDRPKTLPSCKVCGGHALYRDGSCMTCDDGNGRYI